MNQSNQRVGGHPQSADPGGIRSSDQIRAEFIAKSLDRGTSSGDGWTACCPAHDDRNPSLSLRDDDGRVLVHCHAGCAQSDVLDALKGRGLWPESESRERRWPYYRADGELHLTKVRIDRPDKPKRVFREPKGIRPPHPLYRLHELLEGNPAQRVLVVEGEPAADAAREVFPGEPITTWLGGANDWKTTDWTPLHARPVSILSDGDAPGRKVAGELAAHLHGHGAAVKVGLTPGDDWADFVDWLREGRETAIERMQGLLRPYEPGDAPAPTDAPAAPPTGGDKLDINQLGAVVRDDDAGRWAYTAGRGWFRRIEGGLWRRDQQALALRGRFQELIDRGLARPGTRARLAVETVEPAFAIDSDQWDADPHLAGLPNGRALDLQTGEVVDAGDTFITRRLSVVPEDGQPTAWLSFLGETFSLTGETDRVIAWLRWWLRHSLSGDCRDESFVYLFGPRGTGKSCLYETWQHVAGEYAATVPGERFTSDRGAHRQWLANLAGARVVILNELPERGRWQTPDLNALVSGEPITANFMHQGDFTFRSQAHVVVIGNHRPRVSAQSGFWRRLRLLECRHVPSAPDDGLKERLRAEAGRILRWVLDGPEAQPTKPAGMDANARTYMEEADHFAAWLNECVEVDGNGFETFGALRESYESWARREGIDPPMKARTLGTKLTEQFGAPFDKKVSGRTLKCRAGVRLRGVAVADGRG